MYVFGICGRSGSGKSTVCRFLEKRGFLWIDTDKTCREVYDSNQNCVEELCRKFGNGILLDGKIDRKALATCAFMNEENTKALNRISHKYIIESIDEAKRRAEISGVKYVLLDAPLLFEAGIEKQCDATVAVVASRKVLEKRLKMRDGVDKSTVKKRLSAQKSTKFLAEHCDAIVYNGTDLKTLEINTYRTFCALFLKLGICQFTKEKRRYVKKS